MCLVEFARGQSLRDVPLPHDEATNLSKRLPTKLKWLRYARERCVPTHHEYSH